MKIRTFAAGTAIAGALGLSAIGLGTGLATADPKPGPNPPGHDDIWLPGDPPGHNPFGPPGQVKKWDPLQTPPGHWGDPGEHWNDPAYFGLPVVWLPPNIPGVTAPLNVVWNPGSAAWGVWVNPTWFVPLPPA
ncbi:hypothetical protein H7J88_23180 [Mycolicibacterium flavescens]|uniref:Secreted protein n=1 Tax=Mycolicibacterium flavescens TaxID=1776 RepID=A0A1E3RJY3_MYCFV|nr:hypothetical protein [Mycolicibacterium flavescens]MCV7282542.1 hypothetical protein [Mycolicibacterium flavescens]ODQ90168.1 hypothetical protein BHQ18_12090 [Mycolicibacterium flavescens]